MARERITKRKKSVPRLLREKQDRMRGKLSTCKKGKKT